MPSFEQAGNFFGGFKSVYPEYEVITPQTLGLYTVRGLNVGEEENLKGSITTPRRIPEHLNQILWNVIVKKPDWVTDFQSFLSSTTLHDRDALLYALYHITYKDVNNYDITCPSCSNEHRISLAISNIFSMKAWPGDKAEVLTKKIEIDLPEDIVQPKCSVILRQPTLLHESEMTEHLLFQSDKNLEIGLQMLIIDSFKVTFDEGQEPKIINDRENIFRGYTSLPAAIRKNINKRYVDEFGQYSMNLKFTDRCPNCNYSNEVDLDLVQHFFRVLHQ